MSTNAVVTLYVVELGSNPIPLERTLPGDAGSPLTLQFLAPAERAAAATVPPGKIPFPIGSRLLPVLLKPCIKS